MSTCEERARGGAWRWAWRWAGRWVEEEVREVRGSER
jgi:hypothetical protein